VTGSRRRKNGGASQERRDYKRSLAAFIRFLRHPGRETSAHCGERSRHRNLTRKTSATHKCSCSNCCATWRESVRVGGRGRHSSRPSRRRISRHAHGIAQTARPRSFRTCGRCARNSRPRRASPRRCRTDTKPRRRVLEYAARARRTPNRQPCRAGSAKPEAARPAREVAGVAGIAVWDLNYINKPELNMKAILPKAISLCAMVLAASAPINAAAAPPSFRWRGASIPRGACLGGND